MRRGRAAVMVGQDRVETWDVPVADPEPGGVLLRVMVSGVCGSDSHIVSGGVGPMPFPIILGHEGVGCIEKLGEGVSKDYAGTPVMEGDLVYWSPVAQCHRCFACTVLDEMPCENTQYFEHAERPNWGSYADYAWLPNNMAFYRLPDHAKADAVAALGCGLPTVLAGFAQCGPVRRGDTVVVQGAGQVGLAAVLVASLSGAREIIVLDHNRRRLDKAITLGATAAISLNDTSPEERRREINDRLGRRGASVVVEAAGVLGAFPEGIDLTGPHGRYIILGLWGATGTIAVAPRDLSIKNMRIGGKSLHKPKYYYEALQIAAQTQDRYQLADLITHRFSISQATEALAASASGVAIKPVIDPSL